MECQLLLGYYNPGSKYDSFPVVYNLVSSFLNVTSLIYFVYLGDYYRVSNTVRLLQFKFAPPSMGNNQMGSLFDTPPYIIIRLMTKILIIHLSLTIPCSTSS